MSRLTNNAPRAGLIGGAGLLLALSTASASASLVGDTIQLWSQAQLNGVLELDEFGIVQDPGHEFTAGLGEWVLYTIDVGLNSIRLDSQSDWHSPWFNTGFAPSFLEIRDLDWAGAPGTEIVDVIVTFSSTITPEDGAPGDHPAFSADNISFTADSVRISYGGYQFLEGSYINIELVTVPAPGAAGLAAAGVALGLRRRRRA